MNKTIEKLRELRAVFDEIRCRTERFPTGLAQAKLHGPEAMDNREAIELLWERVDLLSIQLQADLQLGTALTVSARSRQLHS